MKFLDRIFGRTDKFNVANQTEPIQTQVINLSSEKTFEHPEEVAKTEENKVPTVHKGPYIGVPIDMHRVGYPIDLVYSFINRDYHQIGYQDALVDGSKEYSETRQSIITNELKTLFMQVTHTYNEMIGNIEQKIEEAEANMLFTIANKLRKTLGLYNEHVATIRQMEEWLDIEDPRITKMLKSYRMGFTKGFIVSCGGELKMSTSEAYNIFPMNRETKDTDNFKTA